MLATCVAPALAWEAAPAAAAAPPLGMSSGILVDLTSGKILWARDDESPRPPASLTKVLTALVVMRNARLDDKVVITPEARQAPGGRTYAEAGWTFSVRDALWGLLLQSGNDTAIALAQKVSPDGSIDGFARMMDATAKEVGATHSHFGNPHGFDQEGHLSTARDLALITMAALKDPVIAEMVATRVHQVPWGDGTMHTYINHNDMLVRYPGTIGVKTGFTAGAGRSLISAVRRGNDVLIAVVMNSPDHYAESKALYDWSFANLGGLRAHPIGVLTSNPRSELLPGEASTLPKVEQLQPEVLAEEEGRHVTSGPLLAPVIALVIALAAASVFRRRSDQVSM
ncbi:MAG TPA: D-alanyl-D-alanine carboxypeptidase family protein [Actinomycetota bacterium]|nr:D-alanyl-D-alanine carboxypeptidase family protein [Actinomycetota bacterium]